MAGLIKYINKDGTGDYTDLVTGINSILASGIASTGVYTELTLYVDSGYYLGSFNADIPYSGTLSIIGTNGTWFEPTGICYISGYYNSETNFNFNNCRIVCSGIVTTVFSIYLNTAVEFNNSRFLSASNTINNSGILKFVSSEACGIDSGVFCISPTGSVTSINTAIGGFDTALSGLNIYLDTSKVLDCAIGINSSNVDISKSLITGVSGIVCNSGTANGLVNINYTTIDSSSSCVSLSGAIATIDRSILICKSNYTINGVTSTGDITNTCMYSGSWDPLLDITGSGNTNLDPLVNNTGIYDYRLRFKDTIGSPCIEYINIGNLADSVNVITEQSNLILKDSVGQIQPSTYRKFVFKQGNSLILSDYLNEVAFAEFRNSYTPINYAVYSKLGFTASGIATIPAIDSADILFPYDWNLKKFNTTEITDEHEYIIPRSVLDFTMAVSEFVGDYLDNIIFSSIDKSMIIARLHKDMRGVAFDYDLTDLGNSIIWTLEGTNQILSKMNVYTNEVLESYPLCIPIRTDKYIYPSGLIPAGVADDKYKYILESDPQQEFLSAASDGGFKWLPTSLNETRDFRGILSYKGNVFITASDYNNPVEDRYVTPTGYATAGKLFMYSNNNTFEHYIANYTMGEPPKEFLLETQNSYPTDITIYEDGNLYIADYANNSGIFKYKLAYDYALITSSYDNDTLVLLRENYEKVEL